jgi:hypothetical protein
MATTFTPVNFVINLRALESGSQTEPGAKVTIHPGQPGEQTLLIACPSGNATMEEKIKVLSEAIGHAVKVEIERAFSNAQR